MSIAKLPKIIVIVGTTASGKTDLGIFLAKKFNGEVVSADSRQVYHELDIGTAKPKGNWENVDSKKTYVVQGVFHHLIDVIDPKEDFNLTDYKKMALGAIEKILKRGKLPILVGGTALYIYAITQNLQIPSVKPSPAIRARLEKKSVSVLFNRLKKLDPVSAEVTGPNKRRLVRALEVIEITGKKFSSQKKKGPELFNTLKIAPTMSQEEVLKRIKIRTKKMLASGLLKEIKKLAKKYSWNLPAMQSIDYQEFKDYLNGKEELVGVIEKINKAHKDLAKRQMTWFRRDKEINWVKNNTDAEKLVKEFL